MFFCVGGGAQTRVRSLLWTFVIRVLHQRWCYWHMLHVGHSNVIIVVLYGRWCTNTGKVNLIKITPLTYSPLLIIVMAWGIRRNVIYRTYMSEDQALHGHKTFEHEFVLILKKPANQITVSIKYSVLIGWFWSTSMKIGLESVMTQMLFALAF